MNPPNLESMQAYATNNNEYPDYFYEESEENINGEVICNIYDNPKLSEVVL